MPVAEDFVACSSPAGRRLGVLCGCLLLVAPVAAQAQAFADAASCSTTGVLTRCHIGAANTLSAITPPAACSICIGDSPGNDCCAHIKGCTPGVRLRDASFPAGDPRFEAIEAVGSDTLRFTGVNVQVVSGAGSTDASVNGRGNLIVGYNENDSLRTRSGSNNLIVGRNHEYTSHGGFVAGFSNVASGPGASVSGGTLNTASGDYSSVSGGVVNYTSVEYASISGGSANMAGGIAASIGGGSQLTNPSASTFMP